jgi:hypothetical protein
MPDNTGQYGVTLTQTPASGTSTTVASFIFTANATPADSWEIKASLPSSLQIGGLTINALTVELKKGSVQPLTPPRLKSFEAFMAGGNAGGNLTLTLTIDIDKLAIGAGVTGLSSPLQKLISQAPGSATRPRSSRPARSCCRTARRLPRRSRPVSA